MSSPTGACACLLSNLLNDPPAGTMNLLKTGAIAIGCFTIFAAYVPAAIIEFAMYFSGVWKASLFWMVLLITTIAMLIMMAIVGAFLYLIEKDLCRPGCSSNPPSLPAPM